MCPIWNDPTDLSDFLPSPSIPHHTSTIWSSHFFCSHVIGTQLCVVKKSSGPPPPCFFVCLFVLLTFYVVCVIVTWCSICHVCCFSGEAIKWSWIFLNSHPIPSPPPPPFNHPLLALTSSTYFDLSHLIPFPPPSPTLLFPLYTQSCSHFISTQINLSPFRPPLAQVPSRSCPPPLTPAPSPCPIRPIFMLVHTPLYVPNGAFSRLYSPPVSLWGREERKKKRKKELYPYWLTWHMLHAPAVLILKYNSGQAGRAVQTKQKVLLLVDGNIHLPYCLLTDWLTDWLAECLIRWLIFIYLSYNFLFCSHTA